MGCSIKHETWFDGNKTLIVCPDPRCEWYYEYRDRTHWISGMTRYWLVSNGYRRIK